MQQYYPILAAVMMLTSVCQAQLYPDLSGEVLIDRLATEYKPSVTPYYSQSKDILYSEIYNVNDSVSCVYSGHRLHVPHDQDPSVILYQDGHDDGINAEHTWPRSKGAKYGLAKSDMHHLYPTRTAVNSARQNFPFAEIPDEETSSWYYKNEMMHTMPENDLDLFAEQHGGLFEPQESHKGNVARAMFYFYTIYRKEAMEFDPIFFEAQRATLCSWHEADPADSLEIARTYMIAAYQDDKTNPFVLDCSLAARTYCTDVSISCNQLTTSTSDLEKQESSTFVRTNPVHQYLHIDHPSIDQGNIIISDSMGRIVYTQAWQKDQEIDIQVLSAGVYYVTMMSEEGGGTDRFVKE